MNWKFGFIFQCLVQPNQNTQAEQKHPSISLSNKRIYKLKNYEYDYPHHSKDYHPIKWVGSEGIKSFSSIAKLNIYPDSISILEQFLCRENTISKYSGGPLYKDIGKYLAYITFIVSRRRALRLILSQIIYGFTILLCNTNTNHRLTYDIGRYEV